MSDSIKLHPDAAAAFNEQGLRIVSQVEVREREPRTTTGPQCQLVPVATFNLQDVQNYQEGMRDVTGTRLTNFKAIGTTMVGLPEEGYKQLRVLAEKIQRTCGFREKVSQKAL